MEVHLDPANEARLSVIASARGLRVDELAQRVLAAYIEDDAHFIEAVNAGIAAADRGDFVDSDAVWRGVEKVLQRG